MKSGRNIPAIAVGCLLSFCLGLIVCHYEIFPHGFLKSLKDIVSGKETRLLKGRLTVDEKLLAGKRNLVILTFGQSNSANHGETRRSARSGVYNFYKGEMYGALDPMLGASGNRGSVWSRLGDKIVAQGFCDNVVFITIGEGLSDIRRWAPGGDLNGRLLKSIRSAGKQGLTVTCLFWHQGERDAAQRTSALEYKRLFLAMLGSIREAGCDAPIFVSIATRGAGRKPDPIISGAQWDLVEPRRGIYSGPDTDALGYAFRYDGTHFSEDGLEKVADLWLECLNAFQPFRELGVSRVVR